MQPHPAVIPYAVAAAGLSTGTSDTVRETNAGAGNMDQQLRRSKNL